MYFLEAIEDALGAVSFESTDTSERIIKEIAEFWKRFIKGVRTEDRKHLSRLNCCRKAYLMR
jgi:predicted secreted Zn-dependent protease